jgi:sulfur carrier protein ThiS
MTRPIAEKIPLNPIASSNLAAVGYNGAKKLLAVQFKHSGQIFHYAGVSSEMWAEFAGSESLGRYYAQNVRGKLQGERMTGPCAKCGAEGWIGETCHDCGTAEHVAAARASENGRDHATARDAAAEVLERAHMTPTRVVINSNGEAVPAKRASELQIPIEVIYVRDDGWSLGAPLRLLEDAYRLWPDHWVEQWAKHEGTGKWERVFHWPERVKSGAR